MKNKYRRKHSLIRKYRKLRMEEAKEKRITLCSLWNDIFFWVY